MPITFDGTTKIATLSNGTVAITVPELWSRWVDWVGTSDNSKYATALSQIGGDALGGGKFLGVTFFLENGWKIRPYEGNHTLVITGNLFSRDGSSPIAPTSGNYNVVVNMATSNLVDTVSTAGGSMPSLPEIASAIWDKMAAAHTNDGSFGEAVGMIKATGDLNFTKLVEVTTKLDTASEILQTLLKYEKNRTVINQSEKTMTVYEDDGVTVLKIFDLKDFTGQPSITTVAERAPR